MGLVKLAVARAPRWTIKKLTETYLTLGLAEIGQATNVEDVEEVRRVVLSMVRAPYSRATLCSDARQIDAGEINATISADGTVAFADDPPVRVSKAEMDAVLARAQAQERVLRALERELARSKEYLSKVRGSCDPMRAYALTDSVHRPSGAETTGAEDPGRKRKTGRKDTTKRHSQTCRRLEVYRNRTRCTGVGTTFQCFQPDTLRRLRISPCLGGSHVPRQK